MKVLIEHEYVNKNGEYKKETIIKHVKSIADACETVVDMNINLTGYFKLLGVD